MRIEGITIYADEGKYIGKKDAKYSEDFGSAFVMSKGETEADYIEVDNLPEESGNEYGWDYGEEVNRRIRRRYTESNEFAILRQKDTKSADYQEYNAYCEQCKLEAQDYKEEYIREHKEAEEAEEKARIEWEKEEAKRREEEAKAEAERIAKEEAERKAWEKEMARMEKEYTNLEK